jgi:drug/metabolite transporter (DMT)-like permease
MPPWTGRNAPLADVLPHAAVAPVPRILTDNASDVLRGIALSVLAYLIWTLGDTAAKWVLPGVGVAGAMLWRGLFGTVTVAAMTIGRSAETGWRRLMPRRWRLVLVRSVLSSFVSVCWYIAWLSMSLADTYAVGFTAPLIMTVMAVPMLGERIRWRRALSTLVGFGGVLIMLRPGGDLWTPVVLLLLVGTLVMALTRIMTRQLTTTETPECQAFWLLICHTVTGVLLLSSFPGAGVIGTVGWLLLAFLGLSSGLAHCDSWHSATCRHGTRWWARWWWRRPAPTTCIASGCARWRSGQRRSRLRPGLISAGGDRRTLLRAVRLWTRAGAHSPPIEAH